MSKVKTVGYIEFPDEHILGEVSIEEDGIHVKCVNSADEYIITSTERADFPWHVAHKIRKFD